MMGTPDLPREVAEQAVRAVHKAIEDGFKVGKRPSPAQVAADRLRIPENTLRDRLKKARDRWGMTPENIRPEKPKVQLPEFPEDDIPVEEIIESLKRRFKKKKARADAEKWYPIKIPEDKPFAICHFGDPHIDSPGCDIETLERHVRLVADTPGVYGLNIGDTVDNWPQSGRLVRLYAESDNSESTAWKLAKWFMRDSGIDWICWLLGNHDLWNQGKHIFREMNIACVPMFEWGAQMLVQCGGKEWKIWASHNFPGFSQWNTLHGSQKAAKQKERADLFISGHLHNWALHQEESGSRDFIYTLARARGYKYLDDYASRLGHFPQEIGHSIVSVHDTDTGRMTCFAEVEEGLEYLKFKRSK